MKRSFLLLILALMSIAQIWAQEPTKVSKRQARKEAKAQQEEKYAQELMAVLDTQKYYFKAQKATTTLPQKPFIDLMLDSYGVVVNGDRISLDLPFFGSSHMVMVNRTNSPICFDGTIDKYQVKGALSDRSGLNIMIETQGDDNKFCRLTFYIFDNGVARLVVQKQGFSDIEFTGEIQKFPIKQEK